MRLEVKVELNLKDKELKDATQKAARLAMRDTVRDIWNEAVRNAPYRKTPPIVSTGHNARSIAGEVSGMGTPFKGKDAEISERVVNDRELEGAVYSTSGYGGYLETGTYKMAPRPYFKPALDRNFTQEKFAQKIKGHLK